MVKHFLHNNLWSLVLTWVSNKISCHRLYGRIYNLSIPALPCKNRTTVLERILTRSTLFLSRLCSCLNNARPSQCIFPLRFHPNIPRNKPEPAWAAGRRGQYAPPCIPPYHTAVRSTGKPVFQPARISPRMSPRSKALERFLYKFGTTPTPDLAVYPDMLQELPPPRLFARNQQPEWL